MANDWVVQPRLPFLSWGKFKTSVVWPAGEKGNWCPDIEILLFSPKPECQLGLDKFVLGELEVLPGATVFTVHMMGGRPNIEFGLKIVDVCKPNVHTVGKEELLGEKYV